MRTAYINCLIQFLALRPLVLYDATTAEGLKSKTYIV